MSAPSSTRSTEGSSSRWCICAAATATRRAPSCTPWPASSATRSARRASSAPTLSPAPTDRADTAAPPQDSPTVLDTIRAFTTYRDGRPTGRFRVRDVVSAPYTCTAVRVGIGDFLQAPADEQFDADDAFDPDNPRLDVYTSGSADGLRTDALTYLLALARPIDQPDFARDPGAHEQVVERLRERIRSLGVDSLSRTSLSWQPGPEISRTEPELTELALFDLDGDGRLEGTGRVALRIEQDIASSGNPEPFIETFDVSLLYWVRDRGAGRPPAVLLTELDVVSGGSWGEGLERVEVMDLDGDGIAEPFYERSGWEGNDFVVYSLVDGRIVQAFEGSGYGC